MKKFLLTISILFCFGMTKANGQVSATFRVDMSEVISGGGTVNQVMSITGVFADRGGNLLNWAVYPMTEIGNQVWEKTVTFTGPNVSTDSLPWIFINGPDWGVDESTIWSNTNSQQNSCMMLVSDFFYRKIRLPSDGNLIISAPWLKCHTLMTDIKTTLKGLQVEVVPNPTSSLLNIRFGGSAGSEIKLLSVDGRVAKSIVTKQSGDFNHTIDVTSLPDGIYYLTVVDGSRVYRTPVVIAN